MIIEFSVKNFRSFRELTTLSLEGESLKTGKSSLISTNFNELLPTVGIFGHNASGKSNLIKALSYMQWAMLNSDYLNQPNTKSPLLQPFLLNIESYKEPSFFQIVLLEPGSETEYRYGFEINGEHVVSEWLEITKKVIKNRSKKMIFTRKGQDFTELDENIKDSVGHLINNVRPTALALTVFAQFADPISSEVIKLIDRSKFMIIDGVTQDLYMVFAMQQYHEQPEFALRVLQLLKKMDLSIQDLKVNREPTEPHLKNIPNEFKALFNQTGYLYRAVTTHKMYGSSENNNSSVEFDFNSQESYGTRRLFILLTLLVQILDLGGVFVLDELGASIHPFMSKEIVEMFQNHTTNPKGAQLIFCSHETFLLSNQVGLRQDQIWFTEKNSQEETVLHSLIEFNMRSDHEFEKNYRQGRFGAVPVIWS